MAVFDPKVPSGVKDECFHSGFLQHRTGQFTPREVCRQVIAHQLAHRHSRLDGSRGMVRLKQDVLKPQKARVYVWFGIKDIQGSTGNDAIRVTTDDRPELYVRRRGVPGRLTDPYIHRTPEDWAEDLAENQEKLDRLVD